jgi:hypothetical protein
MAATVLAAGVALAVLVGERMSTDAMAVALGVVFGVAASIPTSLLIVAATRGRRDDDAVRRRQSELAPPAPQIYVINPGAQPAQGGAAWPAGGHSLQSPWIDGAPGSLASPAGPGLYAAGQPPRRFKLIGEDERWLEEPGDY